MAGSIQTWANPLPGAVSTDLELIFNSLTQWLSAPTFLNGVTVGNGTGIQTGDGSGVTTTLLNTNPSTTAPTDTSAPGTPVVTALGGVRSVLAFWPSVTTANGSPVAHYVAEVDTSNTFGTLVQTLNPVGPVASFDNLVANTTYFVRVAAVSYVGNQGPWSTTASVTTPQIAAGDISANTITAGSAIIGTAAISSAQIASLVADKITAGTINAQTIQLGASGGTAALQSTNYVTGTTGWAVRGDGTAEFSSVNIYGGTLSDSGTYVDVSGESHSSTVTVGSAIMSFSDIDTTTSTNNGTVGKLYPSRFAVAPGVISRMGCIWKGGKNIDQASPSYSTIELGQSGVVIDATTAVAGSAVSLAGSLIALTAAGGNITLTGSGNTYQAVGSMNAAASGALPVIQSGRTSLTFAGGNATLTFPTAFPNTCSAVTGSIEGTNSGCSITGAPTTTSVRFGSSGGLVGAFVVDWIAVGT